MSFLNLRISGRLYAGFGALVFFCAGLAGFGVWQLGEIRAQVGLLTIQSTNTIRASEIAAELEAGRRAILRYAFDRDENSFAEAEKRLNKASELLGAAAKLAVSDERRGVFLGIAKDVEDLKAKRLALGAAVDQMVEGRALLFTDGEKLAADVQKFVKAAEGGDFSQEAAPLEAKILLVQVAGWRMLTNSCIRRCSDLQDQSRQGSGSYRGPRECRPAAETRRAAQGYQGERDQVWPGI